MEGMLKSVWKCMFNMFVFAILSGMVGLVAYEIFQEIGGSSEALHDRYHE